MTAADKLIAQERKAVEDWNANHPIGRAVRYWSMARRGEGVVSRTRSEARMLGDHTAVVDIEGKAGCMALSHVEVLTDD